MSEKRPYLIVCKTCNHAGIVWTRKEASGFKWRHTRNHHHKEFTDKTITRAFARSLQNKAVRQVYVYNHDTRRFTREMLSREFTVTAAIEARARKHGYTNT